MICTRCLRASRTSLRSSFTPSLTRGISSTAPAPISSTPTPAQPSFTTPLAPPKPRPADLPTSIAPAGSVLKNLNYLKGREDPVALAEEEYPEWLWRVLDKKAGAEVEGGEGDGDAYAKSKKLRRKAAKAERKADEKLRASGKVIEKKISITKQTIDLEASGAAREELTEALRKERRKGIKDANFLRSM